MTCLYNEIFNYKIFIIMSYCLDKTTSNNPNSRWQWTSGTVDSSSLSSQSPLSPTAQTTSASIPSSASPTDSAFATSAVYVSPVIGLNKSVSVR
jgi:hypothetical protein